jgi:hypothetical protein
MNIHRARRAAAEVTTQGEITATYADSNTRMQYRCSTAALNPIALAQNGAIRPNHARVRPPPDMEVRAMRARATQNPGTSVQHMSCDCAPGHWKRHVLCPSNRN